MAGQVDRQKQIEKTGSSLTYNEILKLRQAREKEFTIQGIYKYGYRNKEDISNLPASTLVVGSQNVLTNAAEQITIRNGYELDGAAGNQNTYGIDSSYDFNTHVNGVQNLRKWGSNLEVRYQNPVTSAVSWINIFPSLIAANVVNFCSYWEGTKDACLFVNGNLNIYRWTGAIGSFASATSSSITLQGTKSLTNLNFDQLGFLLIDGVKYSYTSAGIIVSQPYTENPTNATVAISNEVYVSQQITTGAAASEITTVTLEIVIANSSNLLPGIPVINGFIFNNNAGVPGSIIVGGANASPISNSSGSYSLTFTFNTPVSPNTIYHLGFNVGWPTDDAAFTIKANIGASGSVGTNTGVGTGFAIPTSWSPSNGYLYMTVNENDTSGTTFNGVTPDPTGAGIMVGDAVVQLPQIGTANVIGVTLPTFDLIECLSNQVYYGSFTNNSVYLSKVNNYTDTTFSSPRVPGEGANANLDAPPIGFKAQAEQMYIASGKSAWWRTVFTLSADLTKESLQINPLQTATNQGAQSQGLIGKLKNSIVFVSNETIINAFGPVKNILGDPNFVNMSDPIKYDIDAYNFAGGEVYYFNYFIYVILPAMGIERLYNVVKKYWEAPQVVPFSRHYEVNGVLYAHSGLTNESYQCYVPGVYSDNGNPINSVIAFPYVSAEGGAANQLKNFNKHYTEGYIAANTTLLLTINYDFGGFSGTYTTTITGIEANIIFNKVTDGSLGQNPLGSEPIGSILNLPNQPAIPKFRIINTFPRVDCFEYQIVLSSDDVDQNYAILRSGPAVSASDNLPVQISH